MLRPLDLDQVRVRLTTRYMGRRLLYYPETPSTMIDADQEARRGAPEGTVVVAERQTAGRGRLQRSWLAPPGSSILLSVILRPKLETIQKVTIAAAVAVARTIEAVTGLSAQVKWPNDVLLNGKKVSGILIESHLTGDKVESAVVGVGINVNLELSAVPEIADIATSLSEETGRWISREDVLVTFLQQLEECYDEAITSDRIRLEWASRLVTIGQQVTATFGNQVEKGIAEGVDEDGALLLRRFDGTLIRVAAGDVTLRPRP